MPLSLAASARLSSALALAIGLITAAPLVAQEAPQQPMSNEEMTKAVGVTWDDGPRTADLGQAEIQLSPQYTFLDADDTRKLMEAYGNPATNIEQGLVSQKADPFGWFIVFEFEDIGYIKDADKEELDADAILASYKEGDRADLKTIGWHTPPKYEPTTNNLEWCLELESEGQRILNHNIRVLGRGGVMKVTLVCDPDQLSAALPQTRAVLGGFAYKPGNRYAEWQPGDKVAEYGLTALVAGGALAVAAKSGLLGKLLKPLLIGGALVIGGLAKFGKRLFGRGETA